MTLEKALPHPSALAERYPVTQAHRIDSWRQQASDILAGKDPRLMVVVGPCSAWPSEAVLKYADNLARLQEELQERMLLVLRCYIQKPRTTTGWPGPLNQPDPEKPVDIPAGIEYCTRLMHQAGERVPLADEMLLTHNKDFFSKYLTYMALGARTGEDQEHRFIASGADVPVGVKNPTSGDIAIGVNGVLAVQAPHVFSYHQHQVSTTGNPFAHLILRGGGGRPNYDPQSIGLAYKLLHGKDIVHPAVIIDASHDNAVNGHGKDPDLQKLVVDTVMSGKRGKREEYSVVKGFMIESFLQHGKQSEKDIRSLDGLSITDPCLGWEETRVLLRRTAGQL